MEEVGSGDINKFTIVCLISERNAHYTILFMMSDKYCFGVDIKEGTCYCLTTRMVKENLV